MGNKIYLKCFPIHFLSACGKISPESKYIKNITHATTLYFTKKGIIMLVYIQGVITSLPPDDWAILYNQYTGDSVLLIGKILQ